MHSTGTLCLLEQTCLQKYLVANAKLQNLTLLPNPGSSATGIPNNLVVLRTAGKKKTRVHASLVALAEYGTFGVEFLTLSERTGNATYGNSAEAVYRSVPVFIHS